MIFITADFCQIGYSTKTMQKLPWFTKLQPLRISCQSWLFHVTEKKL